MKKLLFIIALFSFATLSAQYRYEFKIVKENPHTSVKDQAATGTCWCFATVSFIESEAIRKGTADTTLDLSEMYIVRYIYGDRLRDNYYRYGKGNKGPGSVGHSVLKAMEAVGLMTEEAYHGINYDSKRHNHKALQAELNEISEKAVKEKSGYPHAEIEAALDKYLGPLPTGEFTYNGKSYQNLDFKKALDLNADEYVEITSFTHHPFYKRVPLEIPDNYDHELYYNVPLDDLVAITDNAIKRGYTVAWDSDMSEIYFAHNNHIALFTPGENLITVKDANFPQRYVEAPINQEIRQQMYENYTTVDDHLMHIVGIAHDQEGVKYYKVKNSWGPDNGDGYLYVSESFFKAKTISILVHINAIPRLIRQQMGLTRVFKVDE